MPHPVVVLVRRLVTSMLVLAVSACAHRSPWTPHLVQDLVDAETVQCSDLDGDGHVDCAYTQWLNPTGGSFWVAWGDGTGAFAPQLLDESDHTDWARDIQILAGEHGRRDLIMSAWRFGHSYYRQTSARVFERATLQQTGYGAGSVTAVACCSDRDAPFLTAVLQPPSGEADHRVQFFRAPPFGPPTLVNRGGLVEPSMVVAHDVDGDGQQDAVVAHRHGLSWYGVRDLDRVDETPRQLMDTCGLSQNRRRRWVFRCRGLEFVRMLDVNGDGTLDYVHGGEGYGVGWLDGRPNGRVHEIDFDAPAGFYYADIGDLDGDGDRDDIVTVSMGQDHQIRIYYQTRWADWSVRVVDGAGGGRGVAVTDVIPGGPDEFVVSYHAGDSVSLWTLPAIP